ncbi:MAG TPA: hypothetical protein VLL27_10320 [Solirubrobacterales bacterium]|nr:hypothetical protein [Solirubrobacterales bacterium]
MKQIRKRLTYANVMSTIAVFLVLGGATAFAATKIGGNEIKANAISTGKIKKEAVTTSKVKNGAIVTTKLGDGSVASAKLGDGSVTTGKLADGSVTTGKLASGAVTPAQLSAAAQPTAVAALEVKANGEVTSSTPGVKVVKVGTGAYCVGVGFAAVGGAVSARGDTAPGTTAQTNVPADGNCNTHPGFQNASVYTINSTGSLTDENWSGIFR